MAQTLLDKIWTNHLVATRLDGRDLIYMDRHILHDRHAPLAFRQLEKSGRPVRRPDLTMSVQDHTPSTQPGRDDLTNPAGTDFIRGMREGSRRHGIRLFDIDDPEQGISHVVAPEMGIVLPGATHAVPDSHACTVGGVGAMAFGCGTTELQHILVTQVLALRKPKTMRITLQGQPESRVTAKDLALHVLAVHGVDVGKGYAIEFAGPAVAATSIEGRMTLCNLAPEMGSRTAFVAADESTISWLADRPWAPHGAMWDAAVAFWRTQRSDEDAAFDREIELDCSGLEPQVTWGTEPSQVIGVSGRVPDPAGADGALRGKMERALDYIGLAPGTPIEGVPVDRVFIGSCTNGRLSDLAAAAEVIRGRRVAAGVVAMVSPGSTTVRREAEAAGLAEIFRAAGFFWAESACSMCGGGNGDRGLPGERVISTTSRNFEGRQGRGVRTHLASPAMAAAAAIAGKIVDVRRF